MQQKPNDFVKAGVIGHPINHSLSPLIHGHWIKHYDLNGSYDAVDIHPDAFQDGIAKLIAAGYSGFNVTLPHKQTIFNLCETLSDTAQQIGAVNTVTIRDGKLHGTNTDGFGFVENIVAHEPDFNFEKSKVLIIGAGGAARAVIHGLQQKGVKDIAITNRTMQKAEDLAAQFNSKIVSHESWAKDAGDVDMIVNTTSLGMKGKPPLDIDWDHISTHPVLYDIVYAPLWTEFLKTGKERGNKTITGIGMLLHQARPAFESWFGIMPVVTNELETLVLENVT